MIVFDYGEFFVDECVVWVELGVMGLIVVWLGF